jgi:hypothetical protein
MENIQVVVVDVTQRCLYSLVYSTTEKGKKTGGRERNLRQLVIRTKSSAEYDEGRPTTTCHINAETNFNRPRLLLLA